MKRFVEGADRTQVSLLPDCIDDYVGTENPVRVVEAFVEQLDLREMGFESVDPEATGRPAYHPSVMLKIYIYGYLNRVQSSRRLEHETHRNIELMWLTGRLMPDFKTIANFRKDNGKAIRQVCRQHCPVQGTEPVQPGARSDRWQQVQGGQQPRQELHGGEVEAPDGGDQRKHRALSDVDGHSGSGGAGGGGAQEGPVAGQDQCA
jgi:transposase